MLEKALIISVPILSTNTVPYGPAVVSGILNKHGYDSTVWDLNIDLFHKYQDQWNNIVNLFGNRAYQSEYKNRANVRKILVTIKQMVRSKLKEQNPGIVLLSVFSSQSLDLVIPLSSIIKDELPNCYLLVGGRGIDSIERRSNTNYADFFVKYLPVDCCYLGDAENNLIAVLQSKNRGVFKSPPISKEDLENAPSAFWQGYDFSKYQNDNKELRVPITGSKGCVRDCTFCDVGGSWPKFVYRKGIDIAKEMIDFYRTTGIKNFEFTDNLINGSIKNFREMNSYIAEQEPNVFNYMGYTVCRPKNEFPAIDFKTARIAGANLFKVGIESGSERVRFDMKKKFSNEDITWFAENCHDNGIKQTWLMFVGYPTETEQDFQDSIDLLLRHRHLSGNGLITVFLSLPMMLTANSAFMRKYGEEYGLAHNSSDMWSDFFWTSTIHKTNTFDIRVNRWRRFIEVINKCGYSNDITRQAEKFLEIDGLEQMYKEHYANQKKVIPISTSPIYINQETHV